MADMFFDRPVSQAMGAGLRVPSARFGDDPATRMGTGNLQPTGADALISGRAVPAQAPQALGTLDAVRADTTARAASLFGGPTLGTPAGAPARPPATVYFNQATNEMFAGDRAFKADDVRSALQAAQAPVNTTRPTGAGWVALPESAFGQYLSTFAERRSTGELLGRGAKNIAYGLGTLPGTVASLAGYEETGAALRAPVEALLGESENEQLRSALIAQNSTLFEQVMDAGIESLPILVSSVLGGGIAATVASRAGAAAGTVRAAGMAGTGVANFPLHLAGMYDAAVRNQADMTSGETKVLILGGALANSALDFLGVENRLLSPIVKQTMEGAAKNTIRRRLLGAGSAGLTEGVAEVAQTGIETLMFDPMVRDNLSPQDWKILAPYIAEQYGNTYAVSFFTGLGLGTIAGTILPPGAAVRPGAPKPQIDPTKPKDLNATATEQAAEKEAPKLDYTEPPASITGEEGFDLSTLPQGQRFVPYADTTSEVPGAYTGQVPAGMGSLLRGIPTLARPLGQQTPIIAQTRADLPTGIPPVGERRTRPLPMQGPAPLGEMQGPAPLGEMQGPVRPVSLIRRGPMETGLGGRVDTLAPGERRLRTRPSERPENYAPVADTGSSALAEQLAALRQQQQAPQPAFEETQPGPVAEPVVETVADTGEVTAREYDDAYATWELVRAEQDNPAALPDFDRLREDAQREWIDAVRNGDYLLPEGTPDTELFRALAKRKQSKKAPLVATGVSRRETGPAAADVDILRRRTEQLRARAELERATQAQGARLKDLGARLEAKKPVAPAPAPKAEDVKSKGVEAARERAREAARKEARASNKAVAVAGKPYKDFDDPVGPPMHEVALPDGSIVRIGKTDNGMGVSGWFDMGTGRFLADTKSEAIVRLSQPFETPPTGPGKGGRNTLRAKPKTETTAAAAPAPSTTPKATKSEAAPEPEPEQGPSPEPEPEVQAPKLTLAERVNALSEDDAFYLQTLIDPDGKLDLDLDTAVETKPKLVEAALRKMADTDVRGDEAVTKLASIADTDKDALKLSAMIAEVNRNPALRLGEGWPNRFLQAAMNVREKAPKATYGNNSLLSYVTEDNKPNFATIDGKRQIVSSETGRNALADYNTIDGVVDLDGKPITPLAAGRVELLVRTYAKKLSRAPNITVARNQADLKAKNPALYKRAVAARKKGDFDTANALGYSFGDGEVIVFSDRIGSEAQLNFVLAHESLGHYGLRAIMPAGKFDATMEQVYKSDPLVAAIVDRAVEARGMSRAEATEEYLADYAAVLDMSFLRRVAAAMKNALNAVGFKFSDDMVRHLLRTARRYVRNGKRDNLFSTSDIFRDIQSIESGTDPLDTGRFKEGFTRDNIRTDMVSLDVFGHMPRTMEQVSAALKPSGEKLSSGTEAVIRKFFSLTGFNALDNAGLARLMSIVQRGSEISTMVRNAADEIMGSALDREVRFAGIRIMKGITEIEQLAASRLNYGQQDAVRGGVDARVAATLKALRDAKKSDRMFSIVDNVPKENPDAIAAYIKAGRLELSDAKKMLAKDSRYKKIADELTKDHPTWKAYIAGREAFELGEIEFVRAQYQALVDDRANATMSLLDLLPTPPDGTDKVLPPYATTMFRTWTDVYFSLYSADATVAADNLVATERSARTAEGFNAAVNEALIAKGFDTTKEDAIRKFFKGKEADDFIAQVVAFRKLVVVNEDNKFVVQQKVSEFGAAELSFTSAETTSRKMLIQGYTPINRTEDGFQIRTQVYDAETGEMLQMHDEYRDRAVYRMAGTAEEATRLAAAMEREVSSIDLPPDTPGDIVVKTVKKADGTETKVRAYKVMTRKAGESEFKMREVVIRFESSAAATGVSTPLNLNLNEFLRGLRQYGLNVHPSKLEQIVVDMSAQDARARKRLEQTGNPGYEVQGGVTALESIARHIDTRASLIAKIQMRPKLDRLMNVKLSESRKLWFGDQKRLADLKAAYDKAIASGADERTVFLAKKEYDRLKYQMGKTVQTVNGVPVNMGNKYLSEGHSLLTFINGNRDVNESDWGSGPVASFVRRWVSAVQLGGSLAQPIMNNVGPFTNFIPWLGSFNEKNGYGGGAGIKNAYAQYLRALSDVGGGAGVSFSKRALEMHTADYWNRVATGVVVHDGVSKAEAEFIASETLNGILTPAQANSLLGHSRNYTTNPFVRQALDKWMFFYLSSEQSTRRAAALAAFRVEFDRQAARTGLTAKQLSEPKYKEQYKAIHAAATEFATEGVRLSLGEYGVFNRPAAWRSGLQSFLYMYRVWPTTTIQSLARMDNKGRAAMLLPLLALSGVAGLPFAEDGEDFLDTILQRRGLPIGSVRLEAARLIDEVLPGASPFILNGVLSALLGADVAGRFGVGDFLPGSAGLLPGQELSETIREVLGPAWGFIEGVGKGGSQLVAAPFSDTATVVGAMREGPVTLLRAIGDVAAYTSAGAAVDKRGYVIDPDLTLHTLVTRVLGFTPASVAAQYEVIRLAKRETNYQKQVVAKFRTALLKAEMSGDSVTAASIRRTVKEWNDITDGTLLEIRNFEKNYQRLKKQAMMPAKQRFMQSAGKANQDAIEFIGELTAYD